MQEYKDNPSECYHPDHTIMDDGTRVCDDCGVRFKLISGAKALERAIDRKLAEGRARGLEDGNG